MPEIARCHLKISQRWVTVVLLFIIYTFVYSIRVCLSITITEMVLPPNRTEVLVDDTCPSNDVTSMNPKKRSHNHRYNWSEPAQGLILSSFHMGHVITALCGGMIIQKFGAKRMLSLSLLCLSILALLTPPCTIWGGSTGLIFLRLAMGFSEGVVLPAASTLLAQWVPQDERLKASYVYFNSIPMGTIFGTLPSGLLLEHFDGNWSVVFYFYGAVGLVTLLLQIVLCYNRPSECPFISEKELTYLNNKIKHTHSNLPYPPWRYILKSLPVWAVIIACTGVLCGIVVSGSDMPKYMSSVFKISVKENGYLSSMPYLAMPIIGGFLCWATDKVIAKKFTTVVTARKIVSSVASIGFGAFLVAASYAGCDRTLALVLLTISSGCLSGVFSSINVNPLDLSPNYVATIAGLMHGIATIFSMLIPYVIGLLTPNQTLKEWRLAFWIVFALLVVSNAVFVVFASAEVQEWNDPAFLSTGRKSAIDGNKPVEERVDLLKIPE